MEGERDDVRIGGMGPAPIFSRSGKVVLTTIGVTGKEERRRGAKEPDVLF